MTWGAWLRLARQGRGWSQAELGRQAGIDVKRIWEFERDRRYPAVRTLHRLSGALGLDLPTLAPLPMLRESRKTLRGQGG